MTDVTSERNKIQVEEVSYRSSVSEATFTKMGGSVNWIIDNSTFMVGDIVQSALTEPQFQAQRGADWVLMDGRDVTGSDYEALTGNSLLPDARGRYLRMQDNSAGVDPDNTPLLNNQNDAVGIHDHEYGIGIGDPVPLGGGTRWINLIDGLRNLSTDSAAAFRTTAEGSASESRPKTTVVNFFIKINNSI